MQTLSINTIICCHRTHSLSFTYTRTQTLSVYKALNKRSEVLCTFYDHIFQTHLSAVAQTLDHVFSQTSHVIGDQTLFWVT